MSTDVRFDKIGAVNRAINFSCRANGSTLLRKLVAIVFHVELPALKHPLRLPHPYGIVVNGNAHIGKNVTLFQGVTIGSKRLGSMAGAPVIEDEVVIYPNAVVVGRIRVGAGATVAPNSVVIRDVMPGTTVAGNPAKPISLHSTKAGD